MKYILKLLIITILTLGVSSGTTHAQASLQPGNNSLQNQTGQTQSSVNTQNQTGSVQTSQGGTVINEPSKSALGVVSDPKQTQPSTVIAPSDTLTTNTKPPLKDSSRLPALIIVILLISGGGYLILANRLSKTLAQPVESQETPKEIQIAVEQIVNKKKTRSKKTKQTRKQRKKN